MNLVEQSFRNLVNFHREELLTLCETHRAGHVFTSSKRRSLRKHGVIMRTRAGKGTIYTLTAKAIKVLEEVT